MAELNIPNLNKKSEKYLFKNKINIRRKSKRRLLNESAFMFFSSLILVYINYLIPKKASLIENFLGNFEKSFNVALDLFSYLFQISVVFFIAFSMLLAGVLLIGSLYRLLRIFRRKTKQITYK